MKSHSRAAVVGLMTIIAITAMATLRAHAAACGTSWAWVVGDVQADPDDSIVRNTRQPGLGELWAEGEANRRHPPLMHGNLLDEEVSGLQDYLPPSIGQEEGQVRFVSRVAKGMFDSASKHVPDKEGDVVWVTAST